MKRTQSGFTLIEIAIVLVIIGLLLSGVLKGQELINSAKVKNLANDFKNIPLFINSYQDKYRALPGDDASIGTANTHIANAAACTPAAATKCAPGNGIIDGAWNAHAVTDESYLFWQHVRLAGLTPGVATIPGTPAAGDGYLPVNATGGEIGIQSNANFTTITSNAAGTAGTGIAGTYVTCSQGIPGRFVLQLDIMLDDGNTDAGSMRAADPATAGRSIVTGGIQDGQTYTVCMGA